MKYLNGNYYVEVKDHRYRIHSTENIILPKRDPPTSPRTQYQVQNDTQIRRNQKVIKNDFDELIVKNYPNKKTNKQTIFQKHLPNCPSCKRINWLEFDKGYYCKNCEYIINKQKHQIDKKVLRQDQYFSSRLNYAYKNVREIWTNMVNTTYKSTEGMINKLKQLKGKTELKFYKNISKNYDNMNIKVEQDPFAGNAQGLRKIYHEVLLLKFLQTKPQVKNMNIKYYDLYYTVIKTREEEKIVDDKYENNENDYICLNDIIPNHYVGIKGRKNEILDKSFHVILTI